jgi:hypothetical protein
MAPLPPAAESRRFEWSLAFIKSALMCFVTVPLLLALLPRRAGI